MKQFSIYPSFSVKELKAGHLLIAEPLLNDSNFSRSVILLCEHGDDGSVGFVINHATEIRLGNLIDDMNSDNGPLLFKGGPVQPNTLHLIHKLPGAFGDGKEIIKGVYWGGVFDDLYALASNAMSNENDVRLFLGYSGWAPGQLEQEIKEGTWLIASANEKLLFEIGHDELWKYAIATLGKKYAHLAHMPTDPQLN